VTAQTAWTELTDRLTDLLGRLRPGTLLRLHESDGRFVQLRTDTDRLSAEVSGASAGASVRALGWQDPDDGHCGRWWCDVAGPAPAAARHALAARLVATLRDVFGATTTERVTYQAWADGRHLACDLGLAETRHYAPVAPGGTAERPSGLLRRVRIGAVDYDEELGPDGTWHATEALELAALGELDDELVPIDPAAADRVAAWWRGLADRPAADPRRPRLAMAVEPRPGPRLSDQDRIRVAAYLSEAPMVAATFGFDPDPLDPARPEVVPLNLRTDGEWVWSESLAYFALRYGIAPEPDLLAHLARRDYRLPDVDEPALRRAADLLQGR